MAPTAVPAATTKTGLFPSVVRDLFEPVDIASLVFFRIAFGAVMLWEVWRYFHYGWIEGSFVAPPFHFTYHGFAWVKAWPGVGMYLHFFALGVLAVLILLGLRYRVAAVLFFFGFGYVFLIDKALYLNHLYLICLLSFLLIFLPAHRACSLDAMRNPASRSDFVPAWTLWVLRLQIAIPYSYGALAKLNGDWLQGQPMQMWMSRMTHVQSLVPWFGEPWLALLFSYGGFLFDLLVVPLLLWRRTRAAAFSAAVVFHLLNALMFQIGIFPWFMIAATTMFFAPDWPRRLWRWAPPARPAGRWLAAVPARRHLLLALFATFFLVQLLLPFRHLLYPGHVDWTDQGSRFAWRMMLCDKSAAIRFVLLDPQTGRGRPMDVASYLTSRQLDKMSHDPEMIREFAWHLKQELVRQGQGHVEVRVLALCALNGRRAQLLVDPDIDLGSQPRRWRAQPWIVPLVEPLPAEAWDVPQHKWQQHLDGTSPGGR